MSSSESSTRPRMAPKIFLRAQSVFCYKNFRASSACFPRTSFKKKPKKHNNLTVFPEPGVHAIGLRSKVFDEDSKQHVRLCSRPPQNAVFPLWDKETPPVMQAVGFETNLAFWGLWIRGQEDKQPEAFRTRRRSSAVLFINNNNKGPGFGTWNTPASTLASGFPFYSPRHHVLNKCWMTSWFMCRVCGCYSVTYLNWTPILDRCVMVR
jgi:hypothetical protein